MEKKFRMGEAYDHTSWFTGGMHLYRVISVRKGKVYFDVTVYEVDGVSKRKEAYDLKKDANGQYVKLFSYKGEDCVIRAN